VRGRRLSAEGTRRRALIAVAVAALATLAAIPALASASPTAPLGHAGRWITDADGRVVTLHGVNMVSKRAPYAPDAAGFGADDAAFLSDHGFNTVRLGAIYAGVEPAPGVYDDAYLARLQATEQELAAEGIFTMIDFHQDLYNERFQGEGWPDWAVQDDGIPAVPQLGFPFNYFGMLALNRAFDHFWNNDSGPGGVGLQDRYASAWRHVAGLFNGGDHVLGYDLLNEPWPGLAWPTCIVPIGCLFDRTKLTAFSKRVIAAIRQADTTSLVWYEPLSIFNSGVRTLHGDTGDPRAGFSFHNYCLLEGLGLPLPGPLTELGCRPFENLVFGNALRHAGRTGDTLLLSEFGATDNLATIKRLVEAADRNMVSWQWWHYCGCDDPTTAGPGDKQALVRDPSQPPTGSNVIEEKLDQLERPYPQAVAGTPIRFGYDSRSGVFTLTYSKARAGGGSFATGTTEVYVPTGDFPGGYEVTVQGATVASAPNAEILELVGLASATQVTVTVRPS